MIFFLTATLLLCFVSVSSADLLYQYVDYDASTYVSTPRIGRITQNGSNFSDSSTGFNGGSSVSITISPFNVDGNDRVLVGIGDYTAGYGITAAALTLNLYAADNLSTVLATKTVPSSTMNYISLVAEYGSNILVCGIGSKPTILELNPDTLATVNEYSYDGFDSSFYSSGFCYSDAVVLGGTIYADFGHINTNEAYADRADLVMMDGLGNITAADTNYIYYQSRTGAAISGGNIYISLGTNENTGSGVSSTNYGIWRMNGVNLDNATRVIEGDIRAICNDGNGGLYYVIGSSLMHWNGSSSSIIDSGLTTSAYSDLVYDSRTNTVFIYEHPSSSTDVTTLIAYPNGSSSAKQVISTQAVYWSGNVEAVGNSQNSDRESSSGSNSIPVPDTDSNSEGSQEVSLPSTVIEAVDPSEISASVLEQIAQTISADLHASDLKFITTENISAPAEITNSVYEAIRQDDHEPVYKLNQLTVDEEGWYIFRVNVPEEYQGMSADEFKIYLADQAVFPASQGETKNAALAFGLLNAIEVDAFGMELDTLPAQFLAVALLQGSTPFSVFLGKLLLALLGGCTASTGAISILIIFVPMMLMKIKRRYK